MSRNEISGGSSPRTMVGARVRKQNLPAVRAGHDALHTRKRQVADIRVQLAVGPIDPCLARMQPHADQDRRRHPRLML